jgi:hypothetical protein
MEPSRRTNERIREDRVVLPREGLPHDAASGTSGLLLYKSKHLITYSICVGMPGSGKTGLGIGLPEDPAIGAIRVIAIDPKRDLPNLLLSLPELRPEAFLPSVDADEAGRKGQIAEQFAARTAEAWKEGLATWGEDGVPGTPYGTPVNNCIWCPRNSKSRRWESNPHRRCRPEDSKSSACATHATLAPRWNAPPGDSHSASCR